MKKIQSILFITFLVLFLNSCTRNYQCNCGFKYNNMDSVEVYQYTNVKKKDAQVFCDLQDDYVKTIDANGSCTMR